MNQTYMPGNVALKSTTLTVADATPIDCSSWAISPVNRDIDVRLPNVVLLLYSSTVNIHVGRGCHGGTESETDLGLDPAFQHRLKAIAALKGVSLQGYCQAAIDRELTKDEAGTVERLASDMPDHEMFAQLREEIFGDKRLPGSSADQLREARDIRDTETKGWA